MCGIDPAGGLALVQVCRAKGDREEQRSGERGGRHKNGIRTNGIRTWEVDHQAAVQPEGRRYEGGGRGQEAEKETQGKKEKSKTKRKGEKRGVEGRRRERGTLLRSACIFSCS